VADDPETRRDVFELLADILPQPLEFATTGRTAFGFWQVLDALAGQVRGQKRAMGLQGNFGGRRLGNGQDRRFGAYPFPFFQRQFQLADHPAHPFRTTAEFHAPQLGNDELQMLDLGFPGGKLIWLFKHQRLERLEFIGPNRIHAATLHNQRAGEQPLR
jgi:hypothetical protein